MGVLPHFQTWPAFCSLLLCSPAFCLSPYMLLSALHYLLCPHSLLLGSKQYAQCSALTACSSNLHPACFSALTAFCHVSLLLLNACPHSKVAPSPYMLLSAMPSQPVLFSLSDLYIKALCSAFPSCDLLSLLVFCSFNPLLWFPLLLLCSHSLLFFSLCNLCWYLLLSFLCLLLCSAYSCFVFPDCICAAPCQLLCFLLLLLYSLSPTSSS
jgi:hypothetical protein